MWCNGGQKTDTSKSSDLDNNEPNIHNTRRTDQQHKYTQLRSNILAFGYSTVGKLAAGRNKTQFKCTVRVPRQRKIGDPRKRFTKLSNRVFQRHCKRFKSKLPRESKMSGRAPSH